MRALMRDKTIPEEREIKIERMEYIEKNKKE